jgi:hypothetical protein
MKQDSEKPKKGEKTAKIAEIGIDQVCYMIQHEDLSYADIANRLYISKTTLVDWLYADPERSARAKAACVASAKRCDELALEALHNIPDGADKAVIARQREIASHYRWRAKVRNPMEYGDRQHIELNDVTPKSQAEVDAELLKLVTKAKKK